MRITQALLLFAVVSAAITGCGRHRRYVYAPPGYYAPGGYYQTVQPQPVMVRQPAPVVVLQQPPEVYYTAPQPGYARPAVYNGVQVYIAQ